MIGRNILFGWITGLTLVLGAVMNPAEVQAQECLKCQTKDEGVGDFYHRFDSAGGERNECYPMEEDMAEAALERESPSSGPSASGSEHRSRHAHAESPSCHNNWSESFCSEHAMCTGGGTDAESLIASVSELVSLSEEGARFAVEELIIQISDSSHLKLEGKAGLLILEDCSGRMLRTWDLSSTALSIEP